MVAQFASRGNLRNRVIELENVSTSYAGELKPAIKNISLEIRKGEIVLITGPNGAGKTTLLETILGLLKPYEGKIKLLGYEMPKDAIKARKYCGYLPQDFIKPAGEPFIVKDVVAMGFASIGKNANNGNILEALKKVKAVKLLNKPIGRLSAGQQQKVLMARALARQPKILFLDEPFSSVDKEARHEICDILENLNRNENVTILIVSHITPKIEFDRIIKMKNGMVISC